MQILILIMMLLGHYVLAQTVALSAAIRLLSGLSTDRLKMSAALVLALPQTSIVAFGLVPNVLGRNGWTPASLAVLGVAAASTLAACVFWWSARRGLRVGRYWIEVGLALLVAALQLYSVDNWIAG